MGRRDREADHGLGGSLHSERGTKKKQSRRHSMISYQLLHPEGGEEEGRKRRTPRRHSLSLRDSSLGADPLGERPLSNHGTTTTKPSRRTSGAKNPKRTKTNHRHGRLNLQNVAQ